MSGLLILAVLFLRLGLRKVTTPHSGGSQFDKGCDYAPTAAHRVRRFLLYRMPTGEALDCAWFPSMARIDGARQNVPRRGEYGRNLGRR